MSRVRTRYRPTVRVFTACVAVPVAAALLAGCNPLTTPPDYEFTPAPVSVSSGVIDGVVDGDTVDVRLSTGGDPVRVRVLGIDTPETVAPDAPVECWGPEASAWAHQQLDNAAVTLTSDPVADDTDRYGRALRYVVLPDGRNYSAVTAESGMARAYTYKDQQLSEAANIVAAQSTAQRNGAGLWGSPCYGQTARR
ncbi:nuclease (plasmid) [Rhodococcoides fascians A21d2]|nr:nuclease [Rhodococcus fascians A21d2]